MGRAKEPKPDKVFSRIGEFLQFVMESELHYASDDGSTLEATIKFTNGSYAEFNYEESWVTESGTGWSEELEIKYYAANSG